jgi:hypothetical protein
MAIDFNYGGSLKFAGSYGHASIYAEYRPKPTLQYPGLLFLDMEPRGPFHSDLELWNALSLTLHDPPRKIFPQQALENLKKRLPKCEPYYCESTCLITLWLANSGCISCSVAIPNHTI